MKDELLGDIKRCHGEGSQLVVATWARVFQSGISHVIRVSVAVSEGRIQSRYVGVNGAQSKNVETKAFR